MRSFGWSVFLLGILWLIVALNMDVSVATGYGGRVNNLGLMASKQNHIILGAFITLCGLLTVLLTHSPQAKGLAMSQDADNKASYAFGSVTNAAAQGQAFVRVDDLHGKPYSGCPEVVDGDGLGAQSLRHGFCYE